MYYKRTTEWQKSGTLYYKRTSEWQKSGTLYCKSSEALIANLVFGNNICSLTRYAVELPSKLVLVGGGKKLEKTNSCMGFFATQRGWLHTLVTNEVI